MPRPRSDETRDDFISRCMSVVSNEKDKQDWSDKRKAAYCHGLWEQSKESSNTIKKAYAGPRFVTAVGNPEEK